MQQFILFSMSFLLFYHIFSIFKVNETESTGLLSSTNWIYLLEGTGIYRQLLSYLGQDLFLEQKK